MFTHHQTFLVKPTPMGKGVQAGFVEPLVVWRIEVDDVEGGIPPSLTQPCDEFPPFGADLRGW